MTFADAPWIIKWDRLRSSRQWTAIARDHDPVAHHCDTVDEALAWLRGAGMPDNELPAFLYIAPVSA